MMNNYQHELLIKADASTVYKALTTTDGMRGWWTQDSDVDENVGGVIHLGFGNTRKQMRIKSLQPEREVRWTCTVAHIDLDRLKRKDEWVGTEIVFQLTPAENGHTRLKFEHIGLTPKVECYDICENGWGFFLNSLQQFSETGRGSPYEVGESCGEKTGKNQVNNQTEPQEKSMSTSDTNTVERNILINAPRERVWRALSNAEQFGTWFGVDLTGQIFAAGQRTRGLMNADCGHSDLWFDITVDRIEPQNLFSYRWNPYAVDPKVDYSGEEPTLVTFTLTDAPDGTLLTVVESGFDKVPSHRRLEAFRMHSGGWEVQLKNIARHATA